MNSFFEFRSNEYNISLQFRLNNLKRKFKKWKCDTHTCRFCKKFQPILGFLKLGYGLKMCEFASLFQFFKKLEILSPKNKTITENLFIEHVFR